MKDTNQSDHSIVASLTILILAGTSCSGIKFINSASNLPVPPALQERTLWKDNAIIQYRLDGLSGYVLERPSADADWSRDVQILPDGFAPASTPITDGQFYHSIVDSSIAASASGKIPILSIAANLKTDQKMELSITDAQLIYIDDKIIPWEKIQKYIDENPLRDGALRVWVQGVMLTQMLFSVATETNSDATVSGTAFQVDGKVYNNAALTQRQPFVTMLLVDLNALAAKAKKNHSSVGALAHPEDRSLGIQASDVRWVETVEKKLSRKVGP